MWKIILVIQFFENITFQSIIAILILLLKNLIIFWSNLFFVATKNKLSFYEIYCINKYQKQSPKNSPYQAFWFLIQNFVVLSSQFVYCPNVDLVPWINLSRHVN